MKSCGSGPCRTCCAWDRKAEGITVDGPPTAPWGCGSQASPNLPIFSSGFIARPEEPTQTPFPSCARSRNTDLWRSNTNKLTDCNTVIATKCCAESKDPIIRRHSKLLFPFSRTNSTNHASGTINYIHKSTNSKLSTFTTEAKLTAAMT